MTGKSAHFDETAAFLVGSCFFGDLRDETIELGGALRGRLGIEFIQLWTAFESKRELIMALVLHFLPSLLGASMSL